ncbi:TetR/AcrR family transcriptional regulator [Pseudomonas palleroniana]|uniref:TetR/AcrR family transcriptional regulator n=1 Tax=Pseudomonas palleroniana TaxID=191390 RepID=UPI001FCA9467|nr:TetR/AcrR family transcriptional regulator [Pseudomonas palleroniana]UOK36683.1 TetR/AcrR family transcriptional regulator [Pseudomonas palleroniana]
MSENAREAILEAAKAAAQTHGYNGINFRSIGEIVGIKNASIYYHFASKADLGAAVAERYWQDTAKVLEGIRASNLEPQRCLELYPSIFRTSLENGNRLCLFSFMAAEYEDLPDEVKQQLKTFAEVNIEWLAQVLALAGTASEDLCKTRARAIYAAVAGAQLIARSQGDIAVFDELISNYQDAGLMSGGRGQTPFNVNVVCP